MKLTDIICLAKQGFTAKDIKDLMSLETSDDLQNKPTEEDHAEGAGADEPNEQKDDATQDAEPDIDYKKLYEESQNELKKARKENLQQNLDDPNKPTKQDTINELVRSFM